MVYAQFILKGQTPAPWQFASNYLLHCMTVFSSCLTVFNTHLWSRLVHLYMEVRCPCSVALWQHLGTISTRDWTSNSFNYYTASLTNLPLDEDEPALGIKPTTLRLCKLTSHQWEWSLPAGPQCKAHDPRSRRRCVPLSREGCCSSLCIKNTLSVRVVMIRIDCNSFNHQFTHFTSVFAYENNK